MQAWKTHLRCLECMGGEGSRKRQREFKVGKKVFRFVFSQPWQQNVD